MDLLDQEVKHSAFMDIQHQAAAGLGMQHHQAYSQLRNSYGQSQAHDAFANQQRTPLGGYSFAMNNSPLHNNYSHPGGNPYLGSYAPPPPNVTSCPPCPSPPRESKNETSKCLAYLASMAFYFTSSGYKVTLVAPMSASQIAQQLSHILSDNP